MEKAIIEDDLVIALATGDADGVAIPLALLGLPTARLRFDGIDIIDAAGVTDWNIDALGRKRLDPAVGRQALTCPWDAELVMIDGAWVARTNKMKLKDYAARARWLKEIGGILVGGIAIKTDERTQGVLTAAYVKANADPNYTVQNWKVAPGAYTTLDAATILGIGNAVEAHIAACFALNQTVDAAIEAGTITTEAQIDQAFA